MRSSDFKIHDHEKLDNILVELCELIINKQKEDPDFYGMVAACVLDNQNRVVKSTSQNMNDKWVHAERAAMLKYEHEVGPLEEGSIIITTLSPCSKKMEDRYKESCTSILMNLLSEKYTADIVIQHKMIARIINTKSFILKPLETKK